MNGVDLCLELVQDLDLHMLSLLHQLEVEKSFFSVLAFYSSTCSPHFQNIIGGEFSSVHQNTFHHYRDFWCFDITTHSWDRIDTKIRPSARSGHRLVHPISHPIFNPITVFHDDTYLEWRCGNIILHCLEDSMILE